jgi:magnesium transporter
VYVVDDKEHLVGACSLPALLKGRPTETVGALASPVKFQVRPETDQEEVARIVERHDLRSIPVVDANNHLLGVVHLHDILDVIMEESAEDMMRMAGADEAQSVLDTVGSRVRGRLPSIMIALVIELMLALVIGQFFQQTLETMVLLAAFLPVILATAGGIALQSSTVIVRGLTDGTLVAKRSISVIWSEIVIGFYVSLVCGIAGAGAGWLFNIGVDPGELIVLSLSIFTGMVGAITAAALFGAGTPLLLNKMGRDPATSSGPLVTALNDLWGGTVYLLLAALIQATR